MSQQPTEVSVDLLKGAKGINDQYGVNKLPPGCVAFSENLLAGGESWDRRAGRDYLLSEPGSVLMLCSTSWDDGIQINIGAIGGNAYNLAFSFSFLANAGVQLILQSPDLNWWNVTPDDNGVIAPLVVAAPATAAQAANFTVLNGQSFGFVTSFGTVNRLNIDQDLGIYTQGYGATTGNAVVASDLVFSNASGFSLVIQDVNTNKWFLFIDNDGDMKFKTI